MHLFSLAIVLLPGLAGFYLGFRAFINFRWITKGEITFNYLVLSSVIAGGAGTLIFFSIIAIMGLLDETYIWTVGKILGALLVALIPGGVITIGSFAQAILITRYKKILPNILRREDKNK